MRKGVAILMFVLLAVGAAYAKGLEVNKKAGEYQVRVTIDRTPPVVGTNTVTVAIKDGTGKTITDAKVRVDYSMPAMPGMPAMNYKKLATLKGTEYVAPMNLSMAGPWNIAVKIARGGKTESVRFNIDAQ